MRVIALDTTLARCSVALADEETILALKSEAMTRGHAEAIAPMVDEAMREAGAAFSELDRIVVTTGPGSFTGLRIGLAFARGLAVSLDKPCVGVSTLEALALEHGEHGRHGAAIAHGDDIFAALYEHGRAVQPPARLTLDEARALFADAIVRGPAAERFGGNVTDAPDIAALALRGARLDPALHPPNPLYLRDSGARLPS